MVKNINKRSNESEISLKVKKEPESPIVSKKKKTENGAVQNGHAKNIKKEFKKVKVEIKEEPGKKIVQNLAKKNSGGKAQQQKKQIPNAKKDKLHQVRTEYREKRKSKRKQKQFKAVLDLSAEQLKEKIESIKQREILSKTAKRKMAVLTKKLLALEGTDKLALQTGKNQVTKAKNDKSVVDAKKKQVQSNQGHEKVLLATVKAKQNKNSTKQNDKKSKFLEVKKEDEEEKEDVESGDEDSSDLEEEEEDSEMSVEEDESSVEEEEEEEDEKVAIKNEIRQTKQISEQEGKKKRYVLFVGNLPFNVTEEEIKKHFLAKVSEVVSVRIPKKDNNTSRGFAYVEFGNNTDYEKALSLHHTFVNGRRINVQYSAAGSKGAGNKNEVVAKNFKLQALSKAGKLAGGRNKNNQKNAANKGRQNAQKAT